MDATFDPYDQVQARAALEAAAAAGEPTEIVRVANDYLWVLTEHHHELLLSALEQLPARYLLAPENEMLRLIHPAARVLALAHPVARGEPASDASTMTPRELDEAQVRQMVGRRLNSDLGAAVELAERLDERLSAHQRLTAQDRHRIARIRVQLGTTYLLHGQVRRALSSFTTARRLAEIESIDLVRRDAGARAAVAFAFLGANQLSENALAQSRSVECSLPFSEECIVRTERIAEAMGHLERLSPQAREQVGALDTLDVDDEFWPFIALARARLMLAQGSPVDALAAIELAFETHPCQSDTMADDIRIAVSAECFLALGEVRAAEEICREAGSRLPLVRLARIRALIHSGDLALAAGEARRLRGARATSPASRAEAVLLLAWIGHETNGAIEASHAYSVAQLAIGRQHRRIFATVPESLIAAVASELPESVRAGYEAALDGLCFSAELPRRIQLTPSERKVLEHLDRFEKVADIAEALFLSPNTVKTQLASLYRRLEVGSRAEALAAATRLNLMP